MTALQRISEIAPQFVASFASLAAYEHGAGLVWLFSAVIWSFAVMWDVADWIVAAHKSRQADR